MTKSDEIHWQSGCRLDSQENLSVQHLMCDSLMHAAHQNDVECRYESRRPETYHEQANIFITNKDTTSLYHETLQQHILQTFVQPSLMISANFRCLHCWYQIKRNLSSCKLIKRACIAHRIPIRDFQKKGLIANHDYQDILQFSCKGTLHIWYAYWQDASILVLHEGTHMIKISIPCKFLDANGFSWSHWEWNKSLHSMFLPSHRTALQCWWYLVQTLCSEPWTLQQICGYLSRFLHICIDDLVSLNRNHI